MSLRFYMNKTNGKNYLQLWNDKKNCVSLGTPDALVKTLQDDNKTNKLRQKVTKFLKEINA